jgi:hypothetical protein
MPDPSSWDVICGADSSQVVLGVDFPARRRREAGFPDLANRIGSAYRFLQTKPPAINSGQQPCGDAYVHPWLEGIRQDRHQVLAVLGCRLGSVYAMAIAEGISRWQPMPKIILIDPQFSSVELLCLEFRREISAISSLLGDDEIEQARKAALEISKAATGDVANVAAKMIESYLDVITGAFERVGLGDARSDKSVLSFMSYMSWLSAAGAPDSGPTWKHSTSIASAAYVALTAKAYPAADHGPLSGHIILFDEDPADLLRSASVAQAVRGLLEARVLTTEETGRLAAD